MMDICSAKDLEFIGFYPVLDSISSDKYERSVLVNSLKEKGFDITGWGRGNWTEGPRIVSYEMSNGQCGCKVLKLYYSTDQRTKYRVTERITCKENFEN